MRILLPFPAEELGAALPRGIEALVWDGSGPLPEGADQVEVYVPPYIGDDLRFQVIRQLPRLRLVQTLTAGVDAVTPRLPEGVVLCNARGVHDTSTAELVMALILASARGIAHFVRRQDEGVWDQQFLHGLADSCVLIVGYGSIGAAVDRRLSGFEVDIVRVARTARDYVHGFDDLMGLLPRADVVVLTVPMTAQTRGLVDSGFLAAMKDGALLVNVARGPVVVTDELLRELASGRLRAALDVTDPEPLPPGHPMWSAPNLVLTPHIGGGTAAFLPRAHAMLLDQLALLAAGSPPMNVVSGEY